MKINKWIPLIGIVSAFKDYSADGVVAFLWQCFCWTVTISLVTVYIHDKL